MPDKIPSWFNELCSIFPCMIQRVNGNGFQVDFGKVLQSLIVVAVIAASTSFVTVKVLETEFDNLKSNLREDVIEMKNDIKDIKSVQIEFDKTFDAVAKDIVNVNDRLDGLEGRR